MNNQMHTPRSQKGAVLIFSLVILLVMTWLGISAMSSTKLDMKMASNNQCQQESFQAAETALVIAENKLQADGIILSQLQDCPSGSNVCYEETCEGGLCFNGTYAAGDDQIDCTLDATSPPPAKVWLDTSLNVFTTASKHFTPTVEGDATYVIEFLCYAARGDGTEFDALNPNNGLPLFRITSQAVSKSGTCKTALQSTYRYSD